ncbi:(2Fe-2S) ferredoxin domain-containing protein [Leptolyngbya sp. CCNP1308]|uniref:(2Fe-2S) ferredoxin domain-containing protein n=1 Tax=Leptolyngbya sp. CCNP1308 TaxID=3110255 RepID=UPI002B205958|nr:(2Fe-2S) ferredoxin domain-containing protein [Leptolyngbya sp. CCNP1308]MEA5448109.1 (2Fe-2S) ferredoxin domain-containing protein [Leptolyngbya sp. CCNP1308]
MPQPTHPSTPAPTLKIQVCRKSGCQKRGGQQLLVALEQALRDRNLQTQVEIQYTGCQKHCSDAPTFTVSPGHHRYSRVQPSRLPAILDRHLAAPRPSPGTV